MLALASRLPRVIRAHTDAGRALRLISPPGRIVRRRAVLSAYRLPTAQRGGSVADARATDECRASWHGASPVIALDAPLTLSSSPPRPWLGGWDGSIVTRRRRRLGLLFVMDRQRLPKILRRDARATGRARASRMSARPASWLSRSVNA